VVIALSSELKGLGALKRTKFSQHILSRFDYAVVIKIVNSEFDAFEEITVERTKSIK